tara:strand:- start:930 stop:1388 length:459 start_codon:yes stop_codon:yes gene_type:complete
VFSFLVLTLSWTSTSHAADEFVKVGLLKCIKTGEKINILIHSQYPIRCVFKDASGGTERYTGKTGIKIGLDIETTKKASLNFAVLAVGDLKAGSKSLSGKYIGGKVNASIGIGAGVVALVGGGRGHIAFQPIALETTLGLGAAAGVGFLEID